VSLMSRVQSAVELADWRARVASLYAAVRAEEHPASGHRIWREGRARLFAGHPQSPIAGSPDLLSTGIDYWPYDPALRFTVELLEAGAEDREVDLASDGTVTLRRTATVVLPDPVGASLDVWTLLQYGGGLFVPLRDGTAGDTSYGGGRYLLDTAKGAWLGGEDRSIVLDLNFAYHPSCRYDARWTCPLAPPGNTIVTSVEAGERL
jgi:uncharacterized protein (DUF1684 family)